jgi:hypothetical protein
MVLGLLLREGAIFEHIASEHAVDDAIISVTASDRSRLEEEQDPPRGVSIRVVLPADLVHQLVAERRRSERFLSTFVLREQVPDLLPHRLCGLEVIRVSSAIDEQ